MKAIIQGEGDNVATAIEPTSKGQKIEASYHGGAPIVVTAAEDIPFGFKVAVKTIAKGEGILKYGAVIGVASRQIVPGEQVHVHNVEGARGRGDL